MCVVHNNTCTSFPFPRDLLLTDYVSYTVICRRTVCIGPVTCAGSESVVENSSHNLNIFSTIILLIACIMKLIKHLPYSLYMY